MKNNNSKITFYIQGQQLAARVLLTVWLLVSGLGSTLAAPGGQSDRELPLYHTTQRTPSDPTVVDIPRNPKVNPELLSILHKVIEVEEIDQNVRSAAVEVLASLNLRSLPVLLKATKDKVGHVWTMVTELLLDLTVIKPASLPHLLKAAAEGLDKDARKKAIKALPGLMTHPAFLAACRQAAKEDPNENVRQTMDQAAQHLANSNSTVLRVLFQAVENSDEDISQAAIEAIEKLDEIDPKSLALVLKTVCDNRDKDDKTDVYSAALNARRKLKERQDFLPVLLEVIEDESQENNIRKEAIKIFGKLQNIDPPSFIWPSLTKVIQHPNSDVCEAAVYALRELFQKLTDETERQEAFEALIKASKAPEAAGTTEAQDSKVRWAAIQILGVLEDQAPGFLTLRLKALQQVRMDQNQDINVYAVWALGELFQKLTDETERQEAFEALIKATKDDTWQVRQEAVEVLGELQGLTSDQKSSISSALQKASEDSDKWVRQTAVQALRRLAKVNNSKRKRQEVP